MRKITHVGIAVFTAFVVSTSAMAETVTIGLRSEPSSMDPYFHNLGPNNAMLAQIFGKLIDWGPAMDKLIPRLATSWRRSTTRLGSSSYARMRNSTMAVTLLPMTSSSRLIELMAIPVVTRHSVLTPRARRSRRSTITPSTL